MSKKRPHNKEEMSSQSGKKRRKVLRFKQVVDFQFTTSDNIRHWRTASSGGIANARIKVNQDGGVSCLLKEDGLWKTIKAHLDWIKLKQVIIKEKKR